VCSSRPTARLPRSKHWTSSLDGHCSRAGSKNIVSIDSDTILVWNVRDLNSHACCTVGVDLTIQERIYLVCIQETKLSTIIDAIVSNICGIGLSYSFLPAEGTRGSILFARRNSAWSMSQVHLSTHSLSLKMNQLVAGSSWWVSEAAIPEGAPHYQSGTCGPLVAMRRL
jgi:hypothetical protein